jgi:hypothetical protein
VRLLVMDIPRFIQLVVPLSPLKPMAQSQRGVIRIGAVQVHPLVVAIPRFIPLSMPFAPVPPDDPLSPIPPHAVIEPSALRAAKARVFE